MKDYPRTLLAILDRLTDEHVASADHLREDAEETSNRNHHSRRYVAMFKYLVINSEPIIDGIFENDLEELKRQVKAGSQNSKAIHVRNEDDDGFEQIDLKRIANTCILGIFDLETGGAVAL